MTLASEWSPMFPLVVHQPSSPSSSAVTLAGSVHKSRVTMWCVWGAVEEMMCVVCVWMLQRGHSGDGCVLA